MKTLHVVPAYLPSDGPNSSGVKQAALTLAEGLRTRGVQAVVLLPAPSAHDRDFTDRSISVTHFDDPRHLVLHRQDFTPLGTVRYGLRAPRYAHILRRVIRERQIDLVHNHSSAFPVPSIVAKLLGVPCVTHVQESGFRLGSLQNRIFLRTVPAISNHVICCADYIRKEFLKAGARPDRVTTVYNAVELRRFDGCRERNLRQELGLGGDQPVIGCVGRIAPRKGIDYFIQAAPLVGREITDAVFLVVGGISEPDEGPYLRRLKEMAIDSGLGDRLRFLGARRDIPEIMGTLDVLVFPSPNDIGPHVPIEAMASGTPVVSASIGGAQEEVIDSVTGLQVEPENPEAVAAGVLRLLRDRAFRLRLGTQAATHVRRIHSQERYVEGVCEVYEKILQSRGSCVSLPAPRRGA